MENLNFHKQKLYALIAAALGLIGIILPWLSVSAGAFGGGASQNGFHSWGLVSVLGLIAVIVASLMGDKTKPYDDMFKKVAMVGFGGIALGAIIYFTRILSAKSDYGGFVSVSSGIGLWITIIAGAAGLVWVAGLIKLPDLPKPNSNPHSPPPPPPPPVS
jgi:hypothetical protein